MKKSFGNILISIAVCYFMAIFCHVAYAGDIRTANWNMSVEEVKKVETAVLNENLSYNTHLEYNDIMFGFNMKICYNFCDGKLCQGVISIFGIDPGHAEDVFITLKKKYGRPIISRTVFGLGDSEILLFAGKRSYIEYSHLDFSNFKVLNVLYVEKNVYEKIKHRKNEKENKYRKKLEENF